MKPFFMIYSVLFATNPSAIRAVPTWRIFLNNSTWQEHMLLYLAWFMARNMSLGFIQRTVWTKLFQEMNGNSPQVNHLRLSQKVKLLFWPWSMVNENIMDNLMNEWSFKIVFLVYEESKPEKKSVNLTYLVIIVCVGFLTLLLVSLFFVFFLR